MGSRLILIFNFLFIGVYEYLLYNAALRSFKKYLLWLLNDFVYLLLAGRGLPRCAGSSLDPAGWLPIAAPSPAAKHRLQGARGSAAAAPRP